MKKSDKNILAGLSDAYKVEGIIARMERANKRMFVVAMALAVICSMLIVIVINFIIYERQMETVEESTVEEWYDVDQDAYDNGDNRFNYIGRDGNIYDGASENTSENQN